MKKLEPCPYCGGEPRLWVRKCSKLKYAVGCDDPLCFNWIPKNVRLRELHNYAICFAKMSDLIETWNMRTER